MNTVAAEKFVMASFALLIAEDNSESQIAIDKDEELHN